MYPIQCTFKIWEEKDNVSSLKTYHGLILDFYTSMFIDRTKVQLQITNLKVVVMSNTGKIHTLNKEDVTITDNKLIGKIIWK